MATIIQHWLVEWLCYDLCSVVTSFYSGIVWTNTGDFFSVCFDIKNSCKFNTLQTTIRVCFYIHFW